MSLIDKIFTLQQCDPFKSLRHSELVLTANITKVKKYPKGSIIIPKEAAVQNFFILSKGEAYYKERPLAAFFGAEELMNDVALDEDVIAHEDIEALVINKGHFFTLIYECPGLLIELLGYFGKHRIEA
jgi:signal-transduction protein with cAMP-binding, CBS, and nucleotidyltransferase domain